MPNCIHIAAFERYTQWGYPRDRTGMHGTRSQPCQGTMTDMAEIPDTPQGYRALVVDDEVPLAGVVASYLEREHFEVSVAHNGNDALALAREIDPDVVILDLALPGIDGLEACRQLRTFSDAYVVMLTARDTEIDTVIGLSVGADDYVTKPFSPRELVARIRAMLRRPRTVSAGSTSDPGRDEPPPRVFGDLRIDVAGRQVFIAKDPVMLTRTEFDVLAALSSRPGVVFSRRQLLETAWAQTYVGNEHLVDVHIGHLRRKLGDDPAAPRYVTTVRGVGYRMGGGQ
jgi:DNA-binding response OmpR family regulator